MVLKKCFSLILSLIFTVSLVAQEAEVVEETQGEKALLKGAESYARALEKNDFEKQLELTHPKVVQHYGGVAKMLAAAEREAAQSKRAGFELSEAALADPLPGKAVGNMYYRCVPIRITVEGPFGEIYSQSGLLGLSSDQGKTWTFVSLAQIEMAVLLEIFPELPRELEMPFKQVSTEK